MDAYQTLRSVRQSAKDLSKEIEGWKGFETPPPYAISLLDDLRNDIQTQDLKIRENEVERLIVNDELEEARASLKKSEEELRKVNEELEQVSDVSFVLNTLFLPGEPRCHAYRPESGTLYGGAPGQTFQ